MLAGKIHPRQFGHRLPHRPQSVSHVRRVQPDTLLGGERPDAGPPQRLHQPADAEGVAQVAGDAADVRPLPAVDLQVEVRPLVPEQVDAVDAHRPGGQLHVRAAAGQVVRPLPGHLQRRVRRRGLRDGADESRQGGPDRLLWNGRGSGHRGDTAVGVVGVGAVAEQDAGAVRLAHRLHVLGQPRRRPDAHHQHPGCQRVEGAGVPELRLLRKPQLGAVHHVPRGHPGGLVNHQQTVHCTPPVGGRTFATAAGMSSP